MESLDEFIEKLSVKDTAAAYEALKKLAAISENSGDVYKYFNTFVQMLDSENSYIRSRALILIAANARWDDDKKLDSILSKYLSHVTDEKPITARQCIKSLEDIINCKPYLKEKIKKALVLADTSKYQDSMRPLINKDIAAILKKIG